jgi:hypothetical protein
MDGQAELCVKQTRKNYRKRNSKLNVILIEMTSQHVHLQSQQDYASDIVRIAYVHGDFVASSRLKILDDSTL